MKAAILTNDDDSFYKPLAEGLSRMLVEVGVETNVLYDGLSSLPRKHAPSLRAASGWKNSLLRVAQNGCSWASYHRLVRELRTMDFAVIVGHVPNAYLESFFDDKRLRQDVPHLPIILYDLVYLPTRGNWAKFILENNSAMGIPRGRHWGLDRYDYHLCVTEVSEWPVPFGAEAFSSIGVNLVDPSLGVTSKNDLIALIDFERSDHLHERAVQVLACIESGIPFKVLHGNYPINEIRRIYQSCSLYFVAHRESFGLPICEVQACGSIVLTPYSNWCPSHFLVCPEGGSGQLPTNFIVYNNDKQQLVSELKRLKGDFDSQRVVSSFKQEQPHFYYGNVAGLERFVKLVKDGTVNSNSHKQYPNLSQLVQAVDKVCT